MIIVTKSLSENEEEKGFNLRKKGFSAESGILKWSISAKLYKLGDQMMIFGGIVIQKQTPKKGLRMIRYIYVHVYVYSK
ncbi:unnamed protein product [Linum trigynum]|uniref:Uncharacterized protein n=1 Tax=Linum trigynum TaxID=586398 RepID=A0AAV2GYW3_9ROSI